MASFDNNQDPIPHMRQWFEEYMQKYPTWQAPQLENKLDEWDGIDGSDLRPHWYRDGLDPHNPQPLNPPDPWNGLQNLTSQPEGEVPLDSLDDLIEKIRRTWYLPQDEIHDRP